MTFSILFPLIAISMHDSFITLLWSIAPVLMNEMNETIMKNPAKANNSPKSILSLVETKNELILLPSEGFFGLSDCLSVCLLCSSNMSGLNDSCSTI